MPWRAYFADGERAPRSRRSPPAAPTAGAGRVRIGAEPLDGAPRESTCRRACWPPAPPSRVELVGGIADLLVPGGMLLVHDYGFAEPFNAVETYEPLPPSLPASPSSSFPDGSEEGFPRGFFRVFGNDEKKVSRSRTTSTSPSSSTCSRPSGAVTTIPHGNAILNAAAARSTAATASS